MKKLLLAFSIVVALFLISWSAPKEAKPAVKPLKVITSTTFKKSFNFVIISDWGWNGFKNQLEVADQMGRTADSVDARFVATCGDNFQYKGVASTQDPLWMINFENIYKAPSMQVQWYPVLGNHDYEGNTQAEIDYSKISRRWGLTDHYYTFVRKINDSISARFIFLDTPPFVGEYYKNPLSHSDVFKQDSAKEIVWLKDVLANAKEQWIIAFGHHPVYSASHKHGNTPEMIERVKPLFEKYHVQLYICGHDHDIQHLREKGKNVDYFVTGTGGELRENSSNELSIYSASIPGFSLVSFKADSLKYNFVNTKGEIVYQYSRRYK